MYAAVDYVHREKGNMDEFVESHMSSHSELRQPIHYTLFYTSVVGDITGSITVTATTPLRLTFVYLGYLKMFQTLTVQNK